MPNYLLFLFPAVFCIYSYIKYIFLKKYTILVTFPADSKKYSYMWFAWTWVILTLEFILYYLMLFLPGASVFSLVFLLLFLVFMWGKASISTRLYMRISKNMVKSEMYPYVLDIGASLKKDKYIHLLGALLYIGGISYIVYAFLQNLGKI